MAAIRRWLKVAVLLAVCEVLLMIDMARPFSSVRVKRAHENPASQARRVLTAPAHRGFVV
jgi:hypothetical protein